jgi:ArsR family transcriptional regulator, arsenate/arsenite/antimonite-responsive transcriptional repressor
MKILLWEDRLTQSGGSEYISPYGELQEMEEHGMRDVVTIAKALSDENRVRILAILEGRELCVCQVIELLGLAPSTVSKHLSILKQARLIDGRKYGRWMYYRLADEDVPPVAKDAISWALKGLGRDRQREKDAERLIQILAMDPEVLCLTQRERA